MAMKDQPSALNSAFLNTLGRQDAPEGFYIPQQYARNFIVRAFESFEDNDLIDRIVNIIDHRSNLHTALPDQEYYIQQCRPADLTIDDVKNAGMYIDDFSEKYGPDARQDNPADRAEVDLDYDGTVNTLVYWTHEIGHALADDIGREAGFTHRDIPVNTAETQAYYAQIILYDVTRNNGFGRISDAIEEHFQETLGQYIKEFRSFLRDPTKKISDRPVEFLSALALYEGAKKMTPEARQAFTRTILGADGYKTPQELLAIAGLSSEDDILKIADAMVKPSYALLPVLADRSLLSEDHYPYEATR